MDTLLQDIRYGSRMLLRSPGFSAVALLALMLGIGANTTTFSALNAVLFHPFSFHNQDRLTMLWEAGADGTFFRGSVSPANFNDWAQQNNTLEHAVAINQRSFDLTEYEEPERFMGYFVSPSFFDALGVNALYGRTFTEEAGQPDKQNVVVLKYSLWQRRFGADPNIVNRSLRFNDKNFTVIGVMPPDFNYPFNGGELWAPLVFEAKDLTNRGSHFLQVMGVLKPNVTREQARDDLRSIAALSASQFPQTNAGRTVNVVSLTEDATRGSRMYGPVMFAAVGFVLLIACANVANLLLVRGSSRQKEIAIRMALGATRLRLVRQLLTESVLLSLIGGGLGLLMSVWGVKSLSRAIPDDFSKFIPGWYGLGIDRTAFFFTFIISVSTGLIFGVVPALQVTKTRFNESLKEGVKGSSSQGSHNRSRNVLVVAEVALSLVLLIGAGLMVRSFIELLRSDLGVNSTNVLTMQVSLPTDKYIQPGTRIDFYEQLLSRIAALPGVTGTGGTGNLPMGGSNNSHYLEQVGQTNYLQGRQPLVLYNSITPGYLEAIGTPLIKGRNISAQDRSDTPRVALVNEAFVKRYLPGQDPIGQTFKEPSSPTVSIVGIVADVMNSDFDDKHEPKVYNPYTQDTWRLMNIVIHGESDPAHLTSAVRGEVAALDKTLPVFNVKAMEQVISERLSPKRLASVMMAIFAALALALSGVGIYAVMSYAVSQRTHEIGIRVALGAQPGHIFSLIVKQGFTLVSIGLAIGLAGAFALTRSISQLLYGVTATDPITFFGISFLLAGVAMIACYVPTRKAIRVDPMVALRHE